jgi:hypothetical protein
MPSTPDRPKLGRTPSDHLESVIKSTALLASALKGMPIVGNIQLNASADPNAKITGSMTLKNGSSIPFGKYLGKGAAINARSSVYDIPAERGEASQVAKVLDLATRSCSAQEINEFMQEIKFLKELHGSQVQAYCTDDLSKLIIIGPKAQGVTALKALQSLMTDVAAEPDAPQALGMRPLKYPVIYVPGTCSSQRNNLALENYQLQNMAR